MAAEVWLPMLECESCGAECVQSPCWRCATFERELDELRERLAEHKHDCERDGWCQDVHPETMGL